MTRAAEPRRPANLTVLVVLPGLTPDGGAEQSFVAVAPFLRDAGVRLHLALLTERNMLGGDVERLGVRVHDLSGPPGFMQRARRVHALVRSLHPDLVHATLFDAVVPTQLALLGRSTPLLVTWAGVAPGVRRVQRPVVPAWKLGAVHAVEVLLGHASRSRYHAVTAGVAEVNRRALLVPASRVRVGERGRDPARFRLGPEVGDGVRRDLQLPAGAEVVLAVGRHEPAKAHAALVEQFDRLADHRPAVHLLIAGREGRSTPELLARCERSPHRDRIRLLGHRDDVPALLAAADVFACTSHSEGAAGAVLEAMAAGVPVVVVPLDGLRDVVEDGIDAAVAPRDRLAQAIERVLDDASLRARLVEGASRTFEERFTVERSAASLVAIYRWAAATRRWSVISPRSASSQAATTASNE